MGLSHKLRKFIRTCDIYGYPITLNFNAETKFRSTTGGLFSLITAIVIISLTYRGAVSLIEKTSSNVKNSNTCEVVIQQLIDLEPNNTIAFKDFTFYLQSSFDGQEGLILKKQIFNISVFQVRSYHSNNNRMSWVSQIPLTECAQKQIQKYKLKSSMIQNNGSNLICPSDYERFHLGYHQQGSKEWLLQIQISRCTDYTICFTEQELKSLVESNKSKFFKLSYGFTNTYLDTSNSKSSLYLQEGYFLISFFDYYTRTDILVDKTIFIDDLSLIPFQNNINSTQFYNNTISKYFLVNVKLFSNSGNISADIFIRMNHQITQIKKTYFRIDNFLAYVGGIFQFLMFMTSTLMGSYNMFGFYVSLANKLYTFDLKPSKISFYKRQKLTDDTQLLTLDQIQLKIRSRVNKIRDAVVKFQKGTKQIVNQRRMACAFIPRMNSISPKKGGELYPKLNPDPGSPRSYLEESYSMNQEPSIQLVRNSEINNRMVSNKIKFEQLETIPDNKYQKTLLNNDDPNGLEKQLPLLNLGYISRHDFLRTSIRDVLKYSRHIRMSFVYLFNQLLCKRLFFKANEANRLLDRAVKMLKRDTDITSILYKLQDIDKLKKLLLTQDQTTLFNYSPKPIVRARKATIKGEVQFTNGEVDNPRRHRQTMMDVEKEIKYLSKQQAKKDSLLQGLKKYDTMKAFFKLYSAYDRLYHQNNSEIRQEELLMNNKLMLLIGSELKEVFEVSYFIVEEQRQNSLHHQTTTTQDIQKNEKGGHKSKQMSIFDNFVTDPNLRQATNP